MFVVVKERRAWWPVVWRGAAEDGGALIENRIELRFRLLDVDALEALQKRAAEVDTEIAAAAPGRARSEIYAGLIAEIASDWRGVCAENSEPLPWSADNLRLLMGVPGIFGIVMEAYRDCLAGRAETRLGN